MAKKSPSAGHPATLSVDAAEIEHFSKMAGEWWDAKGSYGALHQLNPVRIRYVLDHVARHFGRDSKARQPLKDLTVIDIGCGGGLLSEPMARLGGAVTGVDPSAESIRVAREHAAQAGLAINYLAATAEDLAAKKQRFDLVLAMEVVEHVADLPAFIETCGQLLKPGGLMALATLNRTVKSYLLAIVGAEYVLGWVPKGTHSWEKFVRPHELARHLRHAGFRMTDLKGASYNPVDGEWRLAADTDVNYFAVAERD
jgi:2-polyprenyl-6-hydroxyphenyl methylase/3-demethylubiquinone-9 3-methyltransferase